MHLAFLNPQGNFDPADSYWTAHPDFGGQLVYVKQVAISLADRGHRVDIVTRRIVDPDWPEFGTDVDGYPEAPGVRIVRIHAGDDTRFLRKEDLWPFLGRDWVPNLLRFYEEEGAPPDACTGHYGDGGLAAALIRHRTGIPFTFTAHSLGAQKLDKLTAGGPSPAELEDRYHFTTRLEAERLAMNHAGIVITSTSAERFEQYGHRAYRGAIDVYDDSRFALVPPGVDLTVFGRDARAHNETEVRGVVEEGLTRDLDADRRHLPLVVASSRLDPKKNHLGLVEAFAGSPELQRSANLLLVTAALDDPLHSDRGAGETERQVLVEIRSLIAAAGLQGRVSAFAIAGQPSLAAAYRYLAQRRSVFALTALYEPFGLAPLEAAAAGLPVVATRNGGPVESLRDDAHEYGVLVDPTDPQDIAAGLLRALGPEWEELAQSGRGRVLDRYTWERTAQGYLAALERARLADRPWRLLLPDYFTARGGPAPGVEELRAI